jgi:AraC-like DNA-binding protein
VNVSKNKKIPENIVEVWRPPEFEHVELCRGRHVTQGYPSHWHDELHFSLVTGGSGYLEHRGIAYAGPAGNLSMVAAGDVHSNWSDHNLGCDFRSMYVDVRLVEKVALELTGQASPAHNLATQTTRGGLIPNQYLSLHRSLECCDNRLQRESELNSFLGTVLLHYSNCKQNARAGSEPDAVRRIREYISDNFADAIPLDKLAAIANLTPYYLNRAFRRHVGVPPHAYQVQLRIMRAKDLLRNRMPIADVALATGFADQSHFGRHFRRAVGMTPATYAVESKNVPDRHVS